MATNFNSTMHAYNPESNSIQLYGVIAMCSITCILSPSQSTLASYCQMVLCRKVGPENQNKKGSYSHLTKPAVMW